MRDPSFHCVHIEVCECSLFEADLGPLRLYKGGFPPEWLPPEGEEKSGLSRTVNFKIFFMFTNTAHIALKTIPYMPSCRLNLWSRFKCSLQFQHILSSPTELPI